MGGARCRPLSRLRDLGGVQGDGGLRARRPLLGNPAAEHPALFITSGFVIFLPTAARYGDFGRLSSFAIRRAARLIPAYYVVLLLAVVLLVIIPTTLQVPGPGTIAAHLAVLQTPALLVTPNFQLGFGVVPPVWTLSVEVGFYVVLPFVAARYFRHPLIGLLTAAGILVVWRVLADNSDGVAHVFGTDLSSAAHQRIAAFYASQFPGWVFAIAIGMTGAWAYIQLRDRVDPARLARIAGRVAPCHWSRWPRSSIWKGERRSRDPSASRDCSPESRFCSSSRPHWFWASSCSPSR